MSSALLVLLAAGVQERVQQGAADRVLAEHHAGDDLVCGDHELAVVTGNIAFLVAHHPHVRVGDVRPRLGVVAVGTRLVRWPPGRPLVPVSCRCVPGHLLGPLRVAAGLSRCSLSQFTVAISSLSLPCPWPAGIPSAAICR
jgi:hypothetical protein